MTGSPTTSNASVVRTRPLLLAGRVGLIVVAIACLGIPPIRKELAIRRDSATTRILINTCRYAEARIPLEHWLKARPDCAEAMFLLAKVDFGLGQFGPGFQALDRAAALGHSLPAVQRERAIAWSKVGRQSEAAPILRRLLDSTLIPDPPAEESLARCYYEMIEFRAARQVIERWVRDAPRDPKPYLWRARTGRKTNATVEALIKDYETALRLDPDCGEARINLADLFLDSFRIEDAQSLYSAQLARRPDDADAHLGLGRIHAQLGDVPSAIRHLEQASKSAPGDPRPLVEQARVRLHANALEPALHLLDEALKIDDSVLDAHHLRGIVLGRLGRDAESADEQKSTARLRGDQETLSRIMLALEKSPRDPDAQYQAAHWLFEHGHADEGLRWAERVLVERPSHFETNQLLSEYYRRRGESGLAHFYSLQADLSSAEPKAR